MKATNSLNHYHLEEQEIPQEFSVTLRTSVRVWDFTSMTLPYCASLHISKEDQKITTESLYKSQSQ